MTSPFLQTGPTPCSHMKNSMSQMRPELTKHTEEDTFESKTAALTNVSVPSNDPRLYI